MTGKRVTGKKITAKLTVADFTSVEFMTAAHKLKVSKQFERFIIARCNVLHEGGHQQAVAAWCLDVYHHFSLHLGHIAHYNRYGFYAEQWEAPQDAMRNMACVREGRDEYGRNTLQDDYGDLNRVLARVAEAYYKEMRESCSAEDREDAAEQLAAAQRRVAALKGD